MPKSKIVRLIPEETKKFKAKYAMADWKPAMPHLRSAQFIQRNKESINQAVRHLIPTNTGCVMSIIVEGAIFKSHILVLCTFCDFFAHGQIPHSMMKLPVSKVTASAFGIIHTWMTRDTCWCTRELMLDVLIAADFLGALDVLNNVFVCLSDKDKYSEMNAVYCFLEARSKGIEPVAALMLQRVGKTFLILVTTTQFLELSEAHLCILLASDYLGVHTEIEVLYASLMWLMDDYEKRKGQMGRVFRLIRFKLMSTQFLIGCTELLHVLGDELAPQLYLQLHMAFLYHQGVRMRDCNATERVWIRDPLCPYVNLVDEDRSEQISVPQFTSYLEKVQENKAAFLARIKAVENEEPRFENF